MWKSACKYLGCVLNECDHWLPQSTGADQGCPKGVVFARYLPRSTKPLHRHARGYCAIVTSGQYDEFSVDGRWQINEGSLVLHPRFHAHANTFSVMGAEVVDMPVPDGLSVAYGVWRIVDALAVIHGDLSVKSAISAGHLQHSIKPPDWIAEMAGRLCGASAPTVAAVASSIGISREHAARAFLRWYGVSPGRFAREHRMRRALMSLAVGMSPADVAAKEGYADQPHLTRQLSQELGVTPGRLVSVTWRRK